jgi:hypothetical protein
VTLGLLACLPLFLPALSLRLCVSAVNFLFSSPLQYKTMSLRQRLEHYFEFALLGANWRTEILAGSTTFMTMA